MERWTFEIGEKVASRTFPALYQGEIIGRRVFGDHELVSVEWKRGGVEELSPRDLQPAGLTEM